ncbi:MAG TPA: sigma 54-interacting transcriptional regulator [Terriglobales bacterium]|nr:sigma 54-interacting transcriptional regulator [Terriglobales bacterium]
MATAFSNQLHGPTDNRYIAVLEVSKAIASHHSLEELFRDLARRLHSVLNFTYLSLLLHHPERNVMSMHTIDTREPRLIHPGMEFSMEESPSAWVWQAQQPLIFRDVRNETRSPRVMKLLLDQGVRSFCGLPLTTPRRRLGAFNIGNSEPSTYDENDLEIPKMVAAQVAIAVENALNYQEARAYQEQLLRERDHLQLLLDVNNAVVSNLAFSELIRAVPTSVRRAMQCDAAFLSVPDSDKTQLRIYGLDFPDTRGFMYEEMIIPIAGSSPGTAFRENKPVVFGTAPTALDPMALEINKGEGFQSGCFLPLVRGDRPLGVLHLLDRRSHRFSDDDVDFLSQVAGQIAIALQNALEYRQVSESRERLAEESSYLRSEIRNEHHFEEILGDSAGLKNVLKQVETVAPIDATVFIYGETGTGKELVARAIHNLSSRRENIFVKLNCAAIPLGLLESELFGHEKGAFTGAIARKIGRFELAHEGTLFLDEVGDIPLELQPKLLRVLQEQEFERLGSNRSIKTDVRLIAATNRDLGKMVEEREFRADLYYRLNVFPIVIPPLRERAEDVPLLVNYFARKYGRTMNTKISTIPKRAIEVLQRYPWPGNIRELQNFIERAVILSTGPVLELPISELKQPSGEVLGNSSRPKTLREAEREHVLQVLEQCHWVLGGPDGAAARLGLPRTTLIYRMRRLGISRRPE